MQLTELITHPERMDRDTLYDLRSLLAAYPYFQTVRILMLQNLYLLHDASFDEELRRAAIYITDRRVIFNLVEAAHYKLRNLQQQHKLKPRPGEDRTTTLIDSFLDTIPVQDDEEQKRKPKRKPTPADAAYDYVSYLLETESDEEKEAEKNAPQLKGQELIDNFINNDGGNFTLQETPEYAPEVDNDEDTGEGDNTGDKQYFTATLAKIYIKQHNYRKALEIITQLNLNYPEKNAYFADQKRFLEKLLLNQRYENADKKK